MSSLHLGRIQLQLNTYSVAYLGRIHLQLNTYSAAAASNFSKMTCLLRTRYGHACIVSYGHVGNLNSPSPSPLPLLPPLLLLMLISHMAIRPNPNNQIPNIHIVI